MIIPTETELDLAADPVDPVPAAQLEEPDPYMTVTPPPRWWQQYTTNPVTGPEKKRS